MKYSIVLMLLLLSGCMYDKIDSREIKVFNNSNRTVFCIISTNDSVNGMAGFGFPSQYNNTYHFHPILPGTVSEPNHKPRFWESLEERSESKKMRLFIIDNDSVLKYGWEKIMGNNIYTKKYTVSINDLDKTNWKIEY